MLPLLTPLATWIGILLLGAIVLKWDAIVIRLKGKKLAVLGARGVGKTSLVQFLATGSIPTQYKQTVSPEKAGPRRFQLKDLDLTVKDTLDVSGDKAAYGVWKKLHDQSDVVLYLLRADRLIVGDTEVEDRVRNDMRHIGKWLEERSPGRPPFFIIGTHCDLDGEFASLPADRRGNYEDSFRKLPVVNELVNRGGGTQAVKVVLGSMKTVEDREALVFNLFKQVVS